MPPQNDVIPKNNPPAAGMHLNLFDDDDDDMGGETENSEPIERNVPEAIQEQPQNPNTAVHRPAVPEAIQEQAQNPDAGANRPALRYPTRNRRPPCYCSRSPYS